MIWTRTHKGDSRCRELADLHYTRMTPGAPLFTRPGFNFVLYAANEIGGRACFVWWRPKWECGQERFDGIRAIECTIFAKRGRWETLASEMILQAIEALQWQSARDDLHLEDATTLPLISGVLSSATTKQRSKASLPGKCFRVAGFNDFEHPKGKADVWLWRNV